MKFTNKNIKNEPVTLKQYRETTPNASFAGFVDTDQNLKKALLIEQGYICAFCMRRISLKRDNYLKRPKIEVGHLKSQKENPKKDLDYMNMVGVCNGNLGGEEHCDKSQKSVSIYTLDPTNKNIEKLITYSLQGEVKSKNNNQLNQDCIDKTLNLNNQHLTDLRIDAYKFAIDLMISKSPPKSDWKKSHFDKIISIYQAKNGLGKYKEFCSAVIWYLELIKSKPKYK